ncbi:hypothetical protein CK203_014299 [Vitis vinifera]|uniref:Reverse transcriptase domain-containing protein n=1 Tax=Vitis vinifera TaxID=29760 RepID=A0A438JI01_VITVI|nr:hypothetical protein CK203_014299 [Vitis vinifera]
MILHQPLKPYNRISLKPLFFKSSTLVLVERKTFLVSREAEYGGNWCSIAKHSRGSVYVLGFEKVEVGWLIEQLTKAIELKSYLGFNKKYRGKFCVHLLEVSFNNHGRFIRISEFATNRKPTFLVIPEGKKGRGWENLKSALASLSMVPHRMLLEMEDITERDEGPRRGGLVPVGRWARAVVCECSEDNVKWDEVGRAVARCLRKKGVATIVPFSGGKGLRRWSPKENSVIEGKFRGGWIELRGVPFHLWSEVHLKKIVEQWGTVTEINWQTSKLFDLSKVKIRIAMKERSVLPALIEVIDVDWVFTISVAMVGEEEARRDRVMGESTWKGSEYHPGTGGGRREERDRSTAGGSFRVGEAGRNEKEGERSSTEALPAGTRDKNGQSPDALHFQPLTAAKMGCNLKSQLRVAQETGEKKPDGEQGSLRKGVSAEGKGKGVPADLDVQTRGSVKKEVKEMKFVQRSCGITYFRQVPLADMALEAAASLFCLGCHRQTKKRFQRRRLSRLELRRNEEPARALSSLAIDKESKVGHPFLLFPFLLSAPPLPLLSPSAHLPSSSVLQSPFPLENRVIPEFLSKNDDVGSSCQNCVGNPILVGVESQPACSNLLPERLIPFKSKPKLPSEVSNLVTVSQGHDAIGPFLYSNEWELPFLKAFKKFFLEELRIIGRLFWKPTRSSGAQHLLESITEEILLTLKSSTRVIWEPWRVEGLDWSPISEESASRLDSPFTEEEIHKAIFSWIGISVGPDGFTIAVFQDCWDVIKEDLVRVFRVSQTSKRGIHETIHSTQGAFVQGRQILDAVLIANEIVDEKRHSGEEGVVLKIDFEKAYDHVSWDFLDHVLEKKGFSPRWRKWMRGCLSTVSFAVLVNGNAKDSQEFIASVWAISGLKVNLDKSNIYGINLEQIIFLAEGKGGLGFGKIVLRNVALLGKWLWRYPREGSALWHKVILSIYGSHSNGWDANTIVRWSHRCPWKAITQVFQEFSKFTRFVVGMGINSVLGRLVTRDHGLYLLQAFYSQVFLSCLISLPDSPSVFPTKFVWNSQVPFKVKSFVWLVAHKKIISVSQDGLGFPEEHFHMLSITFSGFGLSRRGIVLWQAACIALIWVVWRERNARIF